MTHDKCVEHWLRVHGPIAGRVPGVHGFVASELVEPREVTRGDAFDGIAVIWYRAQEPVLQTLSSPEGKAWLADGDTFIQRDRSGGVAGWQHILMSPRTRDGAIKRMDFLACRAGMSAEQFQGECLTRLRDRANAGAGLQGLELTQLRPVTNPRFVFDTVIESWWADDAATARVLTGWRALRSGLDPIADPEKSVSVAVRDHVFVKPPA
jgi:uncharacterized protein (TIGR02118 family)